MLAKMALSQVPFWAWILGGFLVGYGWIVWARVNQRRRLAKLGGSAPVIKTYLPFSIDSILVSLVASLTNHHVDLLFMLFKKNNNCKTLQTGGLARLIFTKEPKNVRAILASQHDEFNKGDMFAHVFPDFLGDSIFARNGKEWSQLRHLLHPEFSRHRIKKLDKVERHVKRLLRAIAKGGMLDGPDEVVDMTQDKGRVTDVAHLFTLFIHDLGIDNFFNLESHTLCSSDADNNFDAAFTRLQSVAFTIGNSFSFLPATHMQFAVRILGRRQINIIRAYADEIVTRALEAMQDGSHQDESHRDGPEKKQQDSYIQRLVAVSHDPRFLSDQVLALISSGRDNPAIVLGWCMYELARHPDVVTKLRNEILQTVGSEALPTYEQLRSMPYLDAILSETLRLYPPVYSNHRQAMRDTTLPQGGGPDGSQPLAILAGTFVVYSAIVIQRDADLLPPESEKCAATDVWSPERWLNNQVDQYSYMPFNLGPRTCLAVEYSLVNMTYTLCRIFQQYSRVQSHMLPIDGGKPKFKAGVFLLPAKGVHVSFHKD